MDYVWIAEMEAGEFDEYLCVSQDPLEAVVGVLNRRYEIEKHRIGAIQEKVRWGHHDGRPLNAVDIDFQKIELGKGYLSSEDENQDNKSKSFCNEIIEEALRNNPHE